MTKITIDRATVEQALEALENTSRVFEDPSDLLGADVDLVLAAITALLAALEQPEREPVEFFDWYDNAHWGNEDFKKGCHRSWNAAIKYTNPPAAQPEQEPVGEVLNERGEIDYISYVPPVGTRLYTAPPAAQPEQEPVAWMADTGSVASLHEKEKGYVLKSAFDIPLYTTPPRREWRGLTRDERMSIINQMAGQDWVYVVDAIEAALKERNT